MARARKGRREGSRAAKGRGEAGNIGILVQRQVKPRWEDDPVRIRNGSWWRGCWVRRGLNPP